MARPTSRQRAAPNPFKAEAARIARDHGGNSRRIEAGLRHIAESFQVDPLAGARDPAYVLHDYPFRPFLDGIKSTSIDGVLSLIDSDDPVAVAKRAMALPYLFRKQIPLYTIDQLAQRIAIFVDYLQRHRDYLIRHGLLPRVFRRCRWPYIQLGRLYDTKRLYGSDLWGFQEQPYRWERLVPTVVSPIRGKPVVGIGYEMCAYEVASLLKGLDPQDARRLEDTRSKMLDLKVNVLTSLASMLRCRNAEAIWPQVVQRITDSLHTDLADFLLRMDRYYMGLDARQDGAGDANPKMIPGGLTNLFEIVGHCEKELRLGPLATAAESFQSAFSSLSLRRQLRTTVLSTTTAAYFVIAANGGGRQLNPILDDFIGTADAEPDFWKEFRGRVNASLLNDFDVEVVTRHRIKRPLIGQFTLEVTCVADFIAAKLKAGSPISLRLTDTIDPPTHQFVFVRKGKLWEVGDSKSTAPVLDLKGMKVIWQLLRKPCRPIHVVPLYSLINPPPQSMQGESSVADLADSQWSKGIPVADREALEACYKQLDFLLSESEQAKRDNDDAKQAKAEREREELLSNVRRLINVADGVREFSDATERLRKSIGKCVSKAITKILVAHPAVGHHLDGAIHTGEFCQYDPRPIPEWKLD